MRELTGEKHGLICLYTRVRVRGGGVVNFQKVRRRVRCNVSCKL